MPRSLALLAGAAVLAACGGGAHEGPVKEAQAAEVGGTPLTVADTTIADVLVAPGTAEPLTQAMVSTKLMGTVTAVLVKEGDVVRAGQPLVRIDARDLEAKREQVRSGIASAEAMQHEASLMATRMRALYADSAAPKAQLDAAEAGLARADAGVRAARAGEAELSAISDYAIVRAPSAGVVTQRMVDPGAFAAPGAPLVTVQDQHQLRVSATIAPAVATTVKQGAKVGVLIEGVPAEGRVEAVVPAPMGGLYQVNALVDNRGSKYAAGGAASLRLPQGTRRAVLVPSAAIRRQGDLTGVQLDKGGIRWIRLGEVHGALVEVVSGLAAGEVIRVPAAGGK